MKTEPKKIKKNGDMLDGITVGALIVGFFGWVPLAGGLIAGLVAGKYAKGGVRGAVTGFIGSILGLVLLFLILAILGGSLGSNLGAISGIIAGGILFLLEIGNIPLAVIGGLIGGMLSPRTIPVVEVQIKETDKKDSDALGELKMRYVKGELTEEQFEKMKEEIK